MKFIFAFAALLLLSACQYDPHAHSYTTDKPSVSDIQGEYELSQIYMDEFAPDIREKIQKLPAPPSIRIDSDGRFTASNFPYFTEVRAGFEYSFEDFRPLSSTWEQTTVGSISNGSETSKDHHGLRLNGLPSHLSFPGFTGMPKVDGLIFGFGDPDSGNAIIFKKK